MFALIACFPRAINSAASPRAPVPQSKISRSPLAVVSSTHEVFPPKWFVPGPGVAIDPLVPQKRTLMNLRVLYERHQSIGNATPRFPHDPPTCDTDSALAGLARSAILPSGRSLGNACCGDRHAAQSNALPQASEPLLSQSLDLFPPWSRGNSQHQAQSGKRAGAGRAPTR